MNVQVLGEDYTVFVNCYVTRNITYVLLDAPIFRQRTKSEPYPPRMDDLESGIYYSAWNQCIAEAIRRFNPHIYHINDYHGAAAPLYLLPSIVPCCLSLHNAEFQGMWPLRTDEHLEEMSSLFNLDADIIQKYIQFGNVFNLLHAGTRYLWAHQQGYGAVGVSKKYSKRVLERYPIFWCLKDIGSLPNPDPSDTAPWDKKMKLAEAGVDTERELERATHRQQAQEWAGLRVDPSAELFIFVGVRVSIPLLMKASSNGEQRWSNQKGVDLIADVFPSILAEHSNTQLVCIGPVIDLYGKFAALKLEKLMQKYPDRVFSKPEFTALPPYIFSGAEFALMPSRDEPFGLVAVEFGRKGALCVGSRVGGFGSMPGWWYTVESITPRHLRTQFKSAINAALKSNQETRAMMRAYSIIQRFPVAQWVENLEKLQSTSIMLSKDGQRKRHPLQAISPFGSTSGIFRGSDTDSPVPSSPTQSVYRPNIVKRVSSFISLRTTPAASAQPSRAPSPTFLHPNDEVGSSGESISMSNYRHSSPVFSPAAMSPTTCPSTPIEGTSSRRLSIGAISQAHTDISIQKGVTPTFEDSKNEYYEKFSEKLDHSNLKSSNENTCIEDFLMESEKEWFRKYHIATLQHEPSSSEDLVKKHSRPNLRAEYNEYLGEKYEAPKGLRKLLEMKIGTWAVYSYLLALVSIHRV
jgi:alpha-1,3-glucan synthase